MEFPTHAIILAAGFGSRLQPAEGHKLLTRVGKRALLDYHLVNFSRLGVRDITVVTGFESAALGERLAGWALPEGMRLHVAYNEAFRGGNGQSVLAGVEAGREAVGVEAAPFWLTMSDHLLDPAIFEALAKRWSPTEQAGVMLAVDAKLGTIFDMPDANKLRVRDGQLDAIGKQLDEFNLVDVGLFWCAEAFVEALREEREARGDCTTSDAMRRLAAVGAAEFWDIGDALWQDVDTPGAREYAESLEFAR